MAIADYSVFEYLYRDSGNFKAYGELLLEGSFSDAEIAQLCSCFEDGECFIAEQLDIPTLYETLWAQCESESSEELDHVWHQFSGVRSATEEDLISIKPWGSAAVMLATVMKVEVWKPSLSRNWEL